MEEKKSIFDYIGQSLTIFGFAMLILSIFGIAFGDEAKNFSTIFALGSQGIPIKIAFEYLVLSFLVTGFRCIFFTDILIKKMAIWLRTICMLTAVVSVIAVFIVTFGWFPVNMWEPWVMFLFSFGLSFAGSYFVTVVKDKQMENALQKLKKEETK